MADHPRPITPASPGSERGAWLRRWLPSLVVPFVLIGGALVVRGAGHLTPVGVLAAFVGSLPLALRATVTPLVYAPILTGGIVLVVWQLDPGDVVAVIPLIALFDIAERGDRRRSWWLAVVSVPCVVVSIVPFHHSINDGLATVAYNLILCLLAIAGGDLVRTRQESGEHAAAVREQAMLRRVGEERLAVAHEIHDVVAHAMTAINVQAGVAAHLLDRDPANAHDALRAIKRTSGDALSDLRATLALLRDPGQTAPLTVALGLGDLDALVTGMRAAGLRITVTVDPLGELPPRVDSTGYRIVQESLTNVVRHAGATSTSVAVRREGDAITIEVRDDGRGASVAAAAGHGLRGMRERVTALNGTLDAGPTDGGGWRVHATLPTP